MELDILQIKEILPHRYPFLLVDKVRELTPGEKAVGIKNVTANEPFFQGHFPEKPLMPGVLMVEALAQVAGLTCTIEGDQTKLGVFTGIDKCKFRRPVVPGDVLELHVEITSFRRGIGKAEGKAMVEGELACSCQLSFALVDR
jgi:3-hydroxyacyl-[acyl-carrier-protein] dehydratase